MESWVISSLRTLILALASSLVKSWSSIADPRCSTSAYLDARGGKTINSFLIAAFFDNNLGLVRVGMIAKLGNLRTQLFPPLLYILLLPSIRCIIHKPHCVAFWSFRHWTSGGRKLMAYIAIARRSPWVVPSWHSRASCSEWTVAGVACRH